MNVFQSPQSVVVEPISLTSRIHERRRSAKHVVFKRSRLAASIRGTDDAIDVVIQITCSASRRVRSLGDVPNRIVSHSCKQARGAGRGFGISDLNRPVEIVIIKIGGSAQRICTGNEIRHQVILIESRLKERVRLTI